MKQPFDIETGESVYSVFPEEDDKYTIFKNGIEYAKIQKDQDNHWLKLDDETELPRFDFDAEVNYIGLEIENYTEEDDDEDDLTAL
jgi:hypothetical protein